MVRNHGKLLANESLVGTKPTVFIASDKPPGSTLNYGICTPLISIAVSAPGNPSVTATPSAAKENRHRTKYKGEPEPGSRHHPGSI